jgi:hypothetical protein
MRCRGWHSAGISLNWSTLIWGDEPLPNLWSVSRIASAPVIAGVLAINWNTSALAQENAVAAVAACAGTGECLCDNSYQDCRSPILQLINNETVGIDVSFWFMTDARYASALIKR